MSGPRIGIVDYANVAPLVDGIEAVGVPWRAAPSKVADALATGEIDMAMLPVVELARMPGVRGMTSWGIAADGACDSVTLYARGALRDVQTVALDASSRTSSALVRILLEREGCRDVRYLKLDEGTLVARLEQADAALLIGDPALRENSSGRDLASAGIAAMDLAREWKRHVALPFVFATWAFRAGFEPDAALLAGLSEAAERGLGRLDAIAQEQATRTGLPVNVLAAYYRQIQYRLDDSHLMGLRAFLDEAHRIGVLSSRPDVQFVA